MLNRSKWEETPVAVTTGVSFCAHTLLYHFLSLLVYHIPAATASIPHFFLSNHKSPLKKYGNLITFPLAELQPITFTTKRSIIYAGLTNSCFHLSFEISSFSVKKSIWWSLASSFHRDIWSAPLYGDWIFDRVFWYGTDRSLCRFRLPEVPFGGSFP